MRHLLDWTHVSDADWAACLARARQHRAAHKTPAAYSDAARGKALGMVFFNSSLRTRTSMELAAVQLGAHATSLDVGQGVWGFEWETGVAMTGDKAEHVREAVGVLSRYYDALGVRVFATLTDRAKDEADALLAAFAEAATVPVVNLESAAFHPCQALADAATLSDRFDGSEGGVAGKRLLLTWAPHPKALPHAVPNSALLMAARLGLDVRLACPKEALLAPGIVAQAEAYAAAHGADFDVTHDLDSAYDGVDVVYAKAWASPLVYDDPRADAALRAAHAGWTVTPDKMARANADAAFMHCLPVRRGVVVADAVLDGPNALHLDQAEYRLHAQKAILEWLWALQEETREV